MTSTGECRFHLRGTEIARLATTMNEMLERVEGSGAQQRAFVGDASHELRIPLTRIRTQLEVEMKDGLDPAAAAALHKEVLGLQDLVEDLLYLAQHDAQRGHRASDSPRSG